MKVRKAQELKDMEVEAIKAIKHLRGVVARKKSARA